MKRPKIISDGVSHHKTYKDSGTFIWTTAPASERKKVDDYLVSINHPSAMEPGTAEHRFKSFVRELAKDKNPVKRKTKKKATRKTARHRNSAKSNLWVVWAKVGNRIVFMNAQWRFGAKAKGMRLTTSNYAFEALRMYQKGDDLDKNAIYGVASDDTTATQIKAKLTGKP